MIVFFVLLGLLVALVLCNFVLSYRHSAADCSVTFLVGQIGAGKSAYSVKMARNYLRRGRPVYSTDYIRGCYRFDISWLSTMKCPEGSLLIIDESALKFNSRDFAKISKEILAYFKKCRHFKNDVILISQTFGDTDKQIREIATRVLFLRKFGMITLPVRVSGDVSIGDDGQPCVKYKIGTFGVPFVPALQGRYYDSWEDDSCRELCPDEMWLDPSPHGEARYDFVSSLQRFLHRYLPTFCGMWRHLCDFCKLCAFHFRSLFIRFSHRFHISDVYSSYQLKKGGIHYE